MSASLNRVELIGRLGKDPELRYRADQTAMARFPLATSKKDKGGEEKTQWHDILIVGRQAEVAAKYLVKGKKVYLEGELEYREQEGRHHTDIRVFRFIML